MIATEIVKGIEHKNLKTIASELKDLPAIDYRKLREWLIDFGTKEIEKHPDELNKPILTATIILIDNGDAFMSSMALQTLGSVIEDNEPTMLIITSYADLKHGVPSLLGLNSGIEGCVNAIMADGMLNDGIPINSDRPPISRVERRVRTDHAEAMFISKLAGWLNDL